MLGWGCLDIGWYLSRLMVLGGYINAIEVGINRDGRDGGGKVWMTGHN